MKYIKPSFSFKLQPSRKLKSLRRSRFPEYPINSLSGAGGSLLPTIVPKTTKEDSRTENINEKPDDDVSPAPAVGLGSITGPQETHQMLTAIVATLKGSKSFRFRTPESISLRVANLEDVDTIVSLLQEDEESPSKLSGDGIKKIAFQSHPSIWILLAETNVEANQSKEIVGVSLFSLGFSIIHGRFPVLEYLRVIPCFRSMGIGTSLISCGMGLALSLGSDVARFRLPQPLQMTKIESERNTFLMAITQKLGLKAKTFNRIPADSFQNEQRDLAVYFDITRDEILQSLSGIIGSHPSIVSTAITTPIQKPGVLSNHLKPHQQLANTGTDLVQNSGPWTSVVPVSSGDLERNRPVVQEDIKKRSWSDAFTAARETEAIGSNQFKDYFLSLQQKSHMSDNNNDDDTAADGEEGSGFAQSRKLYDFYNSRNLSNE